jgi:PAS domain S-box-containing protein
MVILRDITDRQRAEAAIREGREHLRAIVDTAVDGIITISEHGTIETVNHAVERIFQYSQSELLGHNVNILMPDPDHGQHDAYLQRYRDTGEKRIIGVGREVRGRRKDGSLFPVELSISDTRLPGRRFFTAMVRDITERKQAEEELRLMTRELDQRVAVRTEELVRSQGRLRSLATELSLAEQRVRRQVATELHDYLGQLLVLARLKLTQTMRGVEEPGLANQLKEADNALESAISYSRSLVAELTPPILREFGFTMALTWLAQQMQRNHLQVDLQLSAVSLDFPDDEAVLIFLSVRELLMNVVKHAHTDRATVSVSLSPQGEREIAVVDKGRGFDLNSTAVEHKGKLDHFGLFSIRERMAALGGRLEVLSAPQHGTKAVLVLPMASRSSGQLDERTTAGESPTCSRTIVQTAVRVLLVNDHVMVREELKNILSLYDDIAVVGEAADGEEAIYQTEAHRPDVVIMDVDMPTLDGVEATKRIRRRFPSTTVVGLSVQGGDHIERVIKDAGASCFVKKDQAGERLYQAIHRAVQSL